VIILPQADASPAHKSSTRGYPSLVGRKIMCGRALEGVEGDYE